MATIRIDKKKTGNYLSLIESYRDKDGKPRMKTIANLGKAEDFKPETLKRIAQRLFILAGGNLSELKDFGLEEQARYNFGFVQLVYQQIKHFGLHHFCRRVSKQHKLSFDFETVLTLMLIERLNEPASKLANFNNQQEYFGLNQKVKLQWIYRSLDKLDQYSQVIQDQIFLKGRSLFNQQLDVVFYDVTTFYFDSDKEKEDELRQKGFGKDGKIGKTQVVFGMLIDRNKQPVAYQVFQGNMSEGKTLKAILQNLMKRFQLKNIIVVADRAMMSASNIKMVTEDLGLNYIFGEKLKTMKKQIQDQFLDLTKYKDEYVYHKDEQEIKIKYLSIYKGDKKIISTYSKKRAKKDAFEREKRVEKAKQLLKNPSALNKKASYHYINKTDKANKYQLNQSKIERDKLFDGILAISTNVEELKETEILDQYRHLFKIEQSFRTMKSLLEIRPMFHWTDKRIKGHICMCFISFAMLNNIELQLKKAGQHWSENKIIKTLNQMQVSQVLQNH